MRRLLVLTCVLSALHASAALGAVGAVSARREYDILRALPAGRFAAITAGDKPDAQGLTGSNHLNGSWLEAGPQRGSCRAVIAGIVADDLAAADDAWRGIEVAFAHQRADGGFEAAIRPNGASANPTNAAVETAFFFSKNSAVRFSSSANPRTKPTSTLASPPSSPSSAAPPPSSPPATIPSSPAAAKP